MLETKYLINADERSSYFFSNSFEVSDIDSDGENDNKKLNKYEL
jgi:hypothetical protein